MLYKKVALCILTCTTLQAKIADIRLYRKTLDNGVTHYVYSMYDKHKNALEPGAITSSKKQKATKKTANKQKKEIAQAAKSLHAQVHVEDMSNDRSSGNIINIIPNLFNTLYRFIQPKNSKPDLLDGLCTYLKKKDVNVKNIEYRNNIGLFQFHNFATLLAGSVAYALKPSIKKYLPYCLIPSINGLLVHIWEKDKLIRNIKKSKYKTELLQCMKQFKQEDVDNFKIYHLTRLLDLLPMRNSWQNDIAALYNMLEQAENCKKKTCYSFIIAGGYHNYRTDNALENIFGYTCVTAANTESVTNFINKHH